MARTTKAGFIEFTGAAVAEVFAEAAEWAKACDDGVMTVIATVLTYGRDEDPGLPEQVRFAMVVQHCTSMDCCATGAGV
jgi:hypothetical protein